MIDAERDKKDTDNDRITEWENAMEDNLEKIKEIEEQFLQELGGIGSTGYKEAAQSFADAWLDAFSQGEDGIKALEDEFDNLFNNLFKKQIAQRIVAARLEPMFKAIDNAIVDENGEARSLETMLAMLGEIYKSIPETAEEVNAILADFAEKAKEYGIDLSNLNTDSSLSPLQQGIQGVTEATAEALESILNHMNFTLANQASDVAEIRRLLSMRDSFSSSDANSPILSELQAQTRLIESINDLFNDVVKPSGHPEGGAGLRVFLN